MSILFSPCCCNLCNIPDNLCLTVVSGIYPDITGKVINSKKNEYCYNEPYGSPDFQKECGQSVWSFYTNRLVDDNNRCDQIPRQIDLSCCKGTSQEYVRPDLSIPSLLSELRVNAGGFTGMTCGSLNSCSSEAKFTYFSTTPFEISGIIGNEIGFKIERNEGQSCDEANKCCGDNGSNFHIKNIDQTIIGTLVYDASDAKYKGSGYEIWCSGCQGYFWRSNDSTRYLNGPAYTTDETVKTGCIATSEQHINLNGTDCPSPYLLSVDSNQIFQEMFTKDIGSQVIFNEGIPLSRTLNLNINVYNASCGPSSVSFPIYFRGKKKDTVKRTFSDCGPTFSDCTELLYYGYYGSGIISGCDADRFGYPTPGPITTLQAFVYPNYGLGATGCHGWTVWLCCQYKYICDLACSDLCGIPDSIFDGNLASPPAEGTICSVISYEPFYAIGSGIHSLSYDLTDNVSNRCLGGNFLTFEIYE